MSEINLKLTKLVDGLSKEELEALLDESNAKKVQEFCKTLITPKPENCDSLPTEIKVGDRVYELVSFLKDRETNIIGHEMVKRAKETNAHLGEDDAQYLSDHQQDIPEILKSKISFAFTDSGDSDYIFGVYWNGSRWVRGLDMLDNNDWDGDVRVLRRKS